MTPYTQDRRFTVFYPISITHHKGHCQGENAQNDEIILRNIIRKKQKKRNPFSIIFSVKIVIIHKIPTLSVYTSDELGYLFTLCYTISMNTLSKDDRAEILRRSQDGDTQQEIIDAFEEAGKKVSQSTVSRIINQDRNRKAKHELLEDPHPALTTETLQTRFWSKYARLDKVMANRIEQLQYNPDRLTEEIHRWNQRARQATTRQKQEAYEHRANSYRLELAALSNLDEFNSEIVELLQDMRVLAEVLVKIRGVGLGEQIPKLG